MKLSNRTKRKYFRITGYSLAILLWILDLPVWIPITTAVLTWVITILFFGDITSDDDEYSSHLTDKLLKNL